MMHRIGRCPLVFLVWPLVLCACAVVSEPNSGKAPSAPAKSTLGQLTESTALTATKVTCVLDEPIVAGKNVIYCASFQFAWDALRDDVVKEEVHLSDEPPIVPLLNRKSVTKEILSEGSYLAMAGYGEDHILDKINRSLKEKFGRNGPGKVHEPLGDRDILAYAYLFKNLKFDTPLQDIPEPLPFGNADDKGGVESFGIECFMSDNERLKAMAVQVRVEAVNSDTNEFVIGFTTASSPDEVLVAKIPPQETLLASVNRLVDWVREGDATELWSTDKLLVPKIRFGIRHDYTELVGKGLTNPSFTRYVITKARQDTRFNFDENGASLASEARIVAKPIGSRHFVFDGPFLLCMREKGQEMPYLAIWIANRELLVPAN